MSMVLEFQTKLSMLPVSQNVGDEETSVSMRANDLYLKNNFKQYKTLTSPIKYYMCNELNLLYRLLA